MGARKKNMADSMKEARKQQSFAKLVDCPTSPRKMRLVADMIRGQAVSKALFMLQHSTKEASGRMEKLLKSAVANWEAKNEGKKPEESNLIVSSVTVDGGRQLKRLRTAPQGRGHRIRKRSNHVTIFVDSLEQNNA